MKVGYNKLKKHQSIRANNSTVRIPNNNELPNPFSETSVLLSGFTEPSRKVKDVSHESVCSNMSTKDVKSKPTD